MFINFVSTAFLVFIFVIVRVESSRVTDPGTNLDKDQANKKNRLKFFKNQPKKISFTSLLHKSKTSDVITKKSKPIPSSSSSSDEFINLSQASSFIDPFLLRGFPSQPIVPYAPSRPNQHHLLLTPTQLPPPPLSQIGDYRNQFVHQIPTVAEHHLQQPTASMPREILDQNAAQSMEHYQKIRFDKQLADQLPILLASSVQQTNGNDNATNTLIQATSASNSSSNLDSSTAAVALLSERTKNLLNQLNKQNKQSLLSTNIRNNRDISSNTQQRQLSPSSSTINNDNANANNNMGLASLIKSAAEAWAANNAAVSAADANPAIIVEHDGPTITTVDFGNNLLGQQVIRTPESQDEDEEVSAFYNEEETEEGGSHQARRIVRPKHHPGRPPTLRHPVFDQPAPSQMDFFEEQHRNDPPQRNTDERANDMVHGYLRYQRQKTNYPDSINAIKEHNSANESGGSQLEKLIKELQELNKKRENKDRDRDRHHGSASEDYEEILGNDEKDHDEDEKIRLLRKKLLERLKAKHERKKNSIGSADSSSASGLNGSIKIPLHALLLAALDRRMSPSERSQIVAQDGLIIDERNKDIIASGHQEFNDATSELGSLLDVNSLLDEFAASRSSSASATQNLSNVGMPSHTGMVSMDNLVTFDEMNQKNTNETSGGTSSAPLGDNEQSYSATTRTPSTAASSSSTTVPPSESDTYQNKDSQSDTGNSVGRGKGRREAPNDEEGDFDVDKQVEEYSEDKYDKSLEPNWMKSQRGKKSESNGGLSVEFDDDYDEMDKRTRQKILKFKKAPPSRGRGNDEMQYDNNVQKFLNKLQHDTSMDGTDVDRTIIGIERSIPNKSNSRNRHRLKPSRREDDDEDDGGANDNGKNEPSDRDETTAQQGDEDEDDTMTSSGPAESQRKSVSSTWRPSMIDDEVHRIEREAKLRKQLKKF